MKFLKLPCGDILNLEKIVRIEVEDGGELILRIHWPAGNVTLITDFDAEFILKNLEV